MNSATRDFTVLVPQPPLPCPGPPSGTIPVILRVPWGMSRDDVQAKSTLNGGVEMDILQGDSVW